MYTATDSVGRFPFLHTLIFSQNDQMAKILEILSYVYILQWVRSMIQKKFET